MDAHRFQKVAALFEALRARPPAEREALLADQTGSDLALREQVVALLREHDRAEGPLEAWKMPLAAAARISAHPPSDKAPKRIGPFRIIKPLAEGGMGVVYLADQLEPLQRRVALKVIKFGHHREILARFEQERQVLALMNHPNVAGVYDAGTAASGLPYFVMEYVPGRPITVHCDEQRLSIRERVKLFIQVCDAVQHAHQKGIIHRDLKPTNIMVVPSPPGAPAERSNRAGGLCKVIDFGVAKAIDSRRSDATRDGALIGTPEYMSPEQAAGTSDVDTRTDVYCLGLVLYELLTGTHPFDHTPLRKAGLADVQRIIRDVEPPKPSTRLQQIRDPESSARLSAAQPVALDQIARCRSSESRGLIGAVRGDLDWIVMKCLEKDRGRRYATANALALELRRYLDDEAVLAGPPSRWYRLRKLVHRNRRSVLAAGLVAAALLTGSGVATWQAVRAGQQAHRANVQLHLADQRLKEIRQVSEFQSRMVSEIDVEPMGRGIKERFREQVRAALERQYVGDYPDRRKRTPEEIEAELAAYDERADTAQAVDVARRVMDQYMLQPAAAAVENQFGDQPMVQAQIQDAIGTAYQALGLYDAAEPCLRDALQTRRREFGPEHEAVAQSLSQLGALLQAKGDYVTAEELHREALAIRRKLFGDDHPLVATSLNNLAVLLHAKGDYAAAEQMFRQALKLRRERLGDGHASVAITMNDLAALLQATGEYAAAERLYREALALERKQPGDENPDVAQTINNLAFLLYTRGDYTAAEPLYREALTLRRKTMGDEHPDVAESLHGLAMLYRAQGDYAAAEPLCREALTLYRTVLGDRHPEVASSLSDLAELLKAQGDYAAAEQMYREVLALRRQLFGDEHPQVSASLNNLGTVLRAQGKYAEAEPLLREALALHRKIHGDDNPEVACIMNNLAVVLRHRGDYAGAESVLRDVLALQRRLFGEEHQGVARCLNDLAMVLQAQGDLATAERLFRQSLAIYRKLLGDKHPYVAASVNNLAGVLRLQGDYAAAEPLYGEALAQYREFLGDEHQQTQYPRIGLARTLVGLERFSEAEALLQDAAERCERSEIGRRLHWKAVLLTSIRLYEDWHAAEPDAGHDAQAAEWRAKLEEWQATTQTANSP